jgi:hypothetical protein
MQVARYWRMKAQNYRLEGNRDTAGNITLQARPTTVLIETDKKDLPREKVTA